MVNGSNTMLTVEHIRHWKVPLEAVILVASFFASCLSIFVIVTSIKLFRATGDVVHLFICSMTTGDLIISLIGLPIELIDYLDGSTLLLSHKSACTLMHITNNLGVAASAISLTVLNGDKLIFFKFPLKYERIMSKCRSLITIAICWIFTFAFVLTVISTSNVHIQSSNNSSYASYCSLSDTPPFLTWTSVIFFCFICVGSSALLSGYLFVVTRRFKEHSPSHHQARLTSQLKSLLFIFLTTAWTAISLLPYRVYTVYSIHRNEAQQDRESAQKLMVISWTLYYLLALNPVVNPFITSLIYAPYREKLCAGTRHLLAKVKRNPKTPRYSQGYTQVTSMVTLDSKSVRRSRASGANTGLTLPVLDVDGRKRSRSTGNLPDNGTNENRSFLHF